jgi:hypothetical protein
VEALAQSCLGGTERLEYRWETTAIAATAPASEVPVGFEAANVDLDRYSTYYWNALAWSRAPGDPHECPQRDDDLHLRCGGPPHEFTGALAGATGDPVLLRCRTAPDRDTSP